MQTDYRQRNQEIVKHCRAGASLDDVACHYRITRERVRQILNRDAREREVVQQANRLAEEIRLADDLDRAWPVEDLLDALALPTPTRRALELHWAGTTTDANRVSLRELMDLIVSPTPEPRQYLTVPAFNVRGVGGKGFRALVNGVQRLNLRGDCYNAWVERFDLESPSWRIRGGVDYFWSMPNPMRRSQKSDLLKASDGAGA